MRLKKPLIVAAVLVVASVPLIGRAAALVAVESTVGGGPTTPAERFELPDGLFDPALLAAYYQGEGSATSGDEPWIVGNRKVTLAIAGDTQQRSNWCWAASIQAIAQYYGRSFTQCDLVGSASWVSFIAGGCPNMPGTIGDEERALQYAGVPAVAIDRALTFKEIKAQIDAGRPILVNLRRDGAPFSGHTVVIRGYDAKNLGVYLLNPTWSQDINRSIGITPWNEPYPYKELLESAGRTPLGKIVLKVGTSRFDVDAGSSWHSTVLVAKEGESPTLTPKKKTAVDLIETEWGNEVYLVRRTVKGTADWRELFKPVTTK